MKRFGKHLCATAVWLCCSVYGMAQQGSIEIMLGGAANWVSRRSVDASFRTVLTPLGGFGYHQPISKTVGIRSGLLYQQKRSSYESYLPTDSADITITIRQKSTFHYLSIPLQLTITPQNLGDYQWRFAAGMNYGFLVSAFTVSDSTWLREGLTLFETRRGYGNYIAASRSRDENRGNDRSELYLFTPSLRLEAHCTFHKRWSVAVFYEYNLSDVSSNGGVGRVNLHTAGLYLSYRLF